MKKTLFVVLLYITITIPVSGQGTYNFFIKEGAHWEIDEFTCDEFGTCDAGDPGNYYSDTYHNFYKLQGDTVIDSIVYKKMYKAYWAICDNCPSYMPDSRGSSPYQLYALLKEDTTAKKVYWKPVAQIMCDTDSLFIDFSYQPSDTFGVVWVVPVTQTDCFIDTFTIDSINYSGFENYSVKTSYYFNHALSWGIIGATGNLRLFEGIGFSSGFKIEYGTGDGNSLGATLISYCIGSDSTCPANFPDAINTIPPYNPEIEVYPNPATDILVIKSPVSQINLITVLDIDGRNISQGQKSELNISSLSPGLYFLSINTNLGIVHRSFIKQ